MPLIPIFLPHGQSVAASTLAFVDSTGLNPLPPGVIVTIATAGGDAVGTAMLQAGGVIPILIQNGAYVASFVGTQAPLGQATFTSSGSGETSVTVPNYVSPVYSGAGYAYEAAYALVLYWHDVTVNSGYVGQ